MGTPKPRPARRGYVIIAALSGVAVWGCVKAFHVIPAVGALIVIAGVVLLTGVFSVRHRGVNREIRRRR